MTTSSSRSVALDRRALWLAPAALNMAAGVALAAHPNRWADLETIRLWTGQWLFTGKDLYASATSGTDYPPHAIVALSPLTLVPQPWAAALWAAVNIVLAALAGYLAARFVRPRVSIGDAVYLTLLFLCWSGTRTLLQFSLLTLVFGLAAVVLAGERPVWSGVCLGLSLMKPQIALPFLLWILFRRRWSSAAVAILLIAAGTGLFCLRAAANPLNVAVRYAQILRLYFNGEIAMQGIAQLRPLVARLGAGAGAGIELATAAILLPLFALICVEGFRKTNSPSRVMYVAPGLAGVWSLLTFYHLTYGFVLLLPIAAVLLLGEDDVALENRRTIFWMLQAALMIDVPGVWRRFGGSWSDVSILDAVFANFDRFVMLFLFAAVVAVYRRQRATAPALAPAAV
jgi:Glycosyltransferase family 87